MREVVRAIITSSPWKRDSWEASLASHGQRGIAIPVPPRLPEPDVADPKTVAVGKLQNFLQAPRVRERLDRVGAASATVMDALWTHGRTHGSGKVLTTDRSGIGIAYTTQKAKELLELTDGSALEIQASCTTGTVRRTGKPEAFFSDDLSPSEIVVLWENLVMRVSVSILEFLANEERIEKALDSGKLPRAIVNGRSIMGWEWVGFLGVLPNLTDQIGGDAYIELAARRPEPHSCLVVDGKAGESIISAACCLLGSVARGVPDTIVEQIVNLT